MTLIVGLDLPADFDTFIDFRAAVTSSISIVLKLNTLHLGLIFVEIGLPLKNCQALLVKFET